MPPPDSTARGHLPDRSSTEQYLQVYQQQLVLSPDVRLDEILSAAPRSIVALGQAFVAASSTAGASIKLRATDGLQYTGLRPNFQHCVDLGKDAFLEAEAKMQHLVFLSNYATEEGGPIQEILRLCQLPNVAQRQLPQYIKRLKKLSSDCCDDTAALKTKFDQWAQLVALLQRACQEHDSVVQTSGDDLKGEEMKAQETLQFQQHELEEANKRRQEHRQALANHATDMHKAQAKIPQGWNAFAIRAADAAMNHGKSALEGVAATFAALNNIVAAGGPTLNVKVKYDSSKKEVATAKQRLARSSAARRKRSTLAQARRNYLDSQRAYEQCQLRYQDLAREDKEQRAKFNEIQLELQKLAHEKITISEVRIVLERCMASLNDFQTHIMTLQRFFNGINGYVNSLDDTYVRDFTSTATSLSQKDIPVEDRAFFLQSIKGQALKVKASYLLVNECASNYVTISDKHVMPGIQLVNQLILSNNGNSSEDVIANVKQINTYARRAQSEVSIIAERRRLRIEDQFMEMKSLMEGVGQVVAGAEGEDSGEEEENETQVEAAAEDEWDDYDP